MATTDPLRAEIAAYLRRYDNGEAWAGTPEEVADHVVKLIELHGLERPERTLRKYADEIEGWYPPDIFVPPTEDDLRGIREALEASGRKGGAMDALAAHMARHYCGVLRRKAAEIVAERIGDDQ